MTLSCASAAFSRAWRMVPTCRHDVHQVCSPTLPHGVHPTRRKMPADMPASRAAQQSEPGAALFQLDQQLRSIRVRTHSSVCAKSRLRQSALSHSMDLDRLCCGPSWHMSSHHDGGPHQQPRLLAHFVRTIHCDTVRDCGHLLIDVSRQCACICMDAGELPGASSRADIQARYARREARPVRTGHPVQVCQPRSNRSPGWQASRYLARWTVLATGPQSTHGLC